jgi:SAM-dependent methyltransferase
VNRGTAAGHAGDSSVASYGPVADDPGFEPGFPATGHDVLRPLREGHYWFDHRKACIREAVNGCLGNSGRILEFGCGDGDVLGALAPEHRSFGFDRGLEDLAAARSKSLSVVAGEGAAPPFSRVFDLVGLFDVVEHVPNDVGLLRIASTLAHPGGWVLLTVPADPALWTSLDDYAGHKRRYTRSMVEDLCRNASLELVSVAPMFRALWPPARVRAALRGNRPVEDPESEYRVGAVWNRLLSTVLRGERRLFGRSPRGHGTSWLAVTRVPAQLGAERTASMTRSWSSSESAV